MWLRSAAPLQVMDDSNSKAEVQRILREVFENLRLLEHAPGVHMHQVPPDFRVPR